MADASATKVFSSEQLQVLGQQLAEVVGRHARRRAGHRELMTWLDVQLKRNVVLTFGGGVNEIQRELIATAGLGLPRAPDERGAIARPPPVSPRPVRAILVPPATR
jgi:alkylation response protein AidB-like acyl-CoA dehydrogenase